MTNLDFIENIKINEIPWDRLTNFYARSTNFEQLFADAENGNLDAIATIKQSIVHQDGIVMATPFAFLFLCKTYKKNNLEAIKNAIDSVLNAVKYNLEYFENRGKVITLCELLSEENLFHKFENQESENESWGEFDFGKNANSWFYNILEIHEYYKTLIDLKP